MINTLKKGKFIFNDTITTLNDRVNILFKVGNVECNELAMLGGEGPSGMTAYLIYYPSDPSAYNIDAYINDDEYDTHQWNNDEYRTITITNEQEVSDTFYAWLILNASFIPDGSETEEVYTLRRGKFIFNDTITTLNDRVNILFKVGNVECNELAMLGGEGPSGMTAYLIYYPSDPSAYNIEAYINDDEYDSHYWNNEDYRTIVITDVQVVSPIFYAWLIVNASFVPDDSEKCFCHFNGYAVKDATARKDIEVLKASVNELTKVSDTATEGNAELINIRIGADGKTYATAGEAVRTQLNAKADKTSVNTSLAEKANKKDVETALNQKANASEVNTALNQKANAESVNASINGINDSISTINNSLSKKANTSDINSALAFKANTTDVNNALALKADKTDLNSRTTKAYVDSALALKAEKEVVNDLLSRVKTLEDIVKKLSENQNIIGDTITFYISGVDYQVKKGTTFSEWVAYDNSNHNYVIHGNGMVVSNDGSYMLTYNGVGVYGSDEIVPGREYSNEIYQEPENPNPTNRTGYFYVTDTTLGGNEFIVGETWREYNTRTNKMNSNYSKPSWMNADDTYDKAIEYNGIPVGWDDYIVEGYVYTLGSMIDD